ncbi:MAG TPA: FG-GAP-like repeat-containing protein [Balneolaceae bacterium]|nr:FG-GAP-like repeat-containing protein [Balneolaceae bacterium]
MKTNFYYLNGSGVAAGDVDGDGWTDLYFTQLDGPNHLYQNLGGWKFEDITKSSGVAHQGFYSTGATFADVDGDRDLDLLVSSVHKKNVLYLNDGKGHFTSSKNSGLDSAKGSTSMTLADIDGDRDLDLYIARYKEKAANKIFNQDQLRLKNIAKKVGDSLVVRPPFDKHYIITQSGSGPMKRELGERDELFLNKGNGTFIKAQNITQRFLDSQGNPEGFYPDWGLTAKFHDVNGDGLPDLYVCNDFWTPDRLWINQGKGKFKAIGPSRIRSYSFSSMSGDFSDINRDGHEDILVTEMLSRFHNKRLRQFTPDDPYPSKVDQSSYQPQYNRNSLYLNRGDNTFAEISYFSGLAASGWSWGTRFMDVDLDGYQDVFINTGFTFDVQDMDAIHRLFMSGNKTQPILAGKKNLDPYPPLRLRNEVYRNNHDLTFTEQGSQWGLKEKNISQGLATADLDHDGDLDLAINRMNQKALIYENKAASSRIMVQLSAKGPNTQAIGAKIELKGGPGGPAPQKREITAGGGYLSGSEAIAVFAANKNSNHTIKITWPDGKQSLIDSVKANHFYKINEVVIPKKVADNREKPVKAIFKDVSDKIDYRHHEDAYSDYNVQPLLPYKLSRLGPGISWFDYDRDGDEDLFIGSGKNGNLGAFENLNNGSFREIPLPERLTHIPGDQTTILGFIGLNGVKFLVGESNYGQKKRKPPAVSQFKITQSHFADTGNIPGISSSTGPMAMSDYDGDGDLDLFVGGRFVPAHYPMNAISRLFKNVNDNYQLDNQNSKILRKIGLVTGAVFSDYDSDGDEDLILSREWGSIVLLENDNGKFKNVSSKEGLNTYKGWWNGIATGDFNNDGRPDIVATNIGLNTPYQLDIGKPLKMYYQDFNLDHKVDIIESRYDTTIGKYVPIRPLPEYHSVPSVMYRNIRDHKEFSNAYLGKLLGYNPDDQLASKELNTLSSVIFINKKGGFVAHQLPDFAQFSMAFSANVGDFDNDGNEDLFLSQNFFQMRPRFPRMDSGRGIWLKGDGKGNFRVVPGQDSGVKIYGEQRGSALADFNEDGKVDIAVTQNDGNVRLYENRTPKSGIRVQLKGPRENKAGIDSSIRLVYKDGTKGPRREVQAGSGYWSQDSPVQVMGYSEWPAKIEVIWSDGQRSVVDVIENKKEYSIPYPGSKAN